MDNIFLWFLLFLAYFEYICGGLPFNPHLQICCLGSVHPKTETATCCRDRVYNKYQQLCCKDGTLIDRLPPADRRQICCNNTAVLEDPKILCCEDRVAVIANYSDSEEYQCCGKKAYTPSSHTCCGTTILSKSGGKSCCGGTVYDPKKHVCCGTTGLQPNNNGNYSDCCHSTPYNSRLQKCCSGMLIDFPDGAICDPDSYACCGSRLTYPGQRCCHDTVFNPMPLNHSPNDLSYSYCCPGGGIVQDALTEVCCENGVQPRARSSMACCGSTMYDQTISVCCAGKITYHGNAINIRCCDDEPYDFTTALCCDDQVFENIGSKTHCCSVTLISA